MSYTHVFAGDPLDRAERERRDPDWLHARLRDPGSRFLALYDLRPLVRGGERPALAWLGPEVLDGLDGEATPVLLGLRDGVAHFGVDVTRGRGVDALVSAMRDTDFEDPRGVAPHLSLPDSGMLAHAKSIVDWHRRHGFCANCGAPTASRNGGKERVCDGCGAHHFPRTDPVVIMLVVEGGRCLLGRSARRVTGLYSALAGFVDQGESIEEAVRREVMEESSVAVGAVHYHSSQPWPFPSSLMIGCIAEAATTRIDKDDHELADVRWFDRAEVLQALEEVGSEAPGLRLPGTIAIAHFLIRDWANGAWKPNLRPGVAHSEPHATGAAGTRP